MKSPDSVGIRALAVSLPDTVRTNADFVESHPQLVAEAERKSLARLFSTTQSASEAAAPFDRAMEAYLRDPFRGAVERRVLVPGETSLEHETRACRRAMRAMGTTASDIDLLLVGSFQPDQPGIGNAAFLGRELQLECPAWNLESACSTSLVALQTARALILAGDAELVMVAISCSYSRDTDPDDTLAWFMGDAAGAFIVGRSAAGAGILGQTVVDTRATCNTFYYANVAGPDRARLRLRCSKQTQRILRETSGHYVRAACHGAIGAAGLIVDDVDFFVFNTPTAWFAPFACDVLGIPMKRTLDTYPRYGNIGPALMPVNLWEAARGGMVPDGATVCIYTIGSVSTASAAVVRWRDVSVWNGDTNSTVGPHEDLSA